MATDDRLLEYRKKRDFRRTGEPKGAEGDDRRHGDGAPRFVIHKHDASTLHYDFRLEADARRNPASTQPRSVLSGRTLEEIAAHG